MIINKDYMMVMRAGKLYMQNTKKQNDSGVILGVCLFMGTFIIAVALIIK